jgi:AbrB family looped-hinge helix DNA binding protein
MRITSKGRVTIPAKIRQQAGLLPGTEVDFEFDGIVVSIVPKAAEERVSLRICAHGKGMSP